MATKSKWYGMNWIRSRKRDRIYRRDGRQCLYCGRHCSSKIGRPWERASLDHVIPLERGGTNAASNLVLACRGCNARRRDLPILDYLGLVARTDAQFEAWVAKLARRLSAPLPE